MMLVCRSFMGRLRVIIHVLTIEIDNLLDSFFDLLGLDLTSTNPVLANVHVGFGLSRVRGSVQSPFTAGTAHPQQILAAVSRFRGPRGSPSVFVGASTTGRRPDVRAYPVASMGLGLAQGGVRSLAVIRGCAQDAPGGLSAGDIGETDLTEGMCPQWPRCSMAGFAFLWRADAR
jgi:hypothetical protein